MPSSWSWNAANEPVLETGLRGYEATPIRVTDVQAWCEMSPAWANLSPEKREAFMARQVKFIENAVQDAQPFVDAFRCGQVPQGSPIWVARDVKNDGMAVGRFIFNEPEDDDHSSRNVGWATHPDYRQRGIAKALVKAVLQEYAGKVMKLRDVTAECEASNIASMGVLRCTGFQKTGESQDEDGEIVYEYIKVLDTFP